LTLSYATSRYQYGQSRYNDPSRFLEELGNSNIDSLMSISKEKTGFPKPKILGNFKKLGPQKVPALGIDPSDFQPSPASQIKEGMKVIHLKFGQGTVKSIDERMVASIYFADLSDSQEKRIMLKYAKLQIVD